MNRILKASAISTSFLLSAAAAVHLLPSPSLAVQSSGPNGPLGTARPVREPIAARPGALPEAAPGEVRRIVDQPSLPASDRLEGRPLVPIFAVFPDPESEGSVRERQWMAAGSIGRQAEQARFVPEARLRHFAWLRRDGNPPILGWKGTIRHVAEAPGITTVRVRVQPVFPHTWLTSDYTEETYSIEGGIVQPPAIEPADPSRPRILSCQ